VESQSLETGRPSGREPDSPFEVVVSEAIQRHGYEVDCQVGVANYFIDLAIRHPDKPDTYLLGVECDGATYHSARAARDRDKYRQGVLEGLGWEIYRIWSTDWFENPEAETRKLLAHLEQLLDRRAA
jgi:very-short-patch-repair endonuclease